MKPAVIAFLLLSTTLPGPAPAGELRQKPQNKPAALPAPKQTRSNPCAEFGPGFVQVEGSSTCVRLGGSIGVGAGIRR